MTNEAKTRQAALIETMGAIVGAPVELTIRSENEFTFSTETVVADLGEKIAAYFGALANVTVEHDDECGSFAYVAVA